MRLLGVMARVAGWRRGFLGGDAHDVQAVLAGWVRLATMRFRGRRAGGDDDNFPMDEIDEMVVAVRADTARSGDIAALRAELGGELVGEAERAGRGRPGAGACDRVGQAGVRGLKRCAVGDGDIARG